MENRTAVVFGASGLVGGYLLEELIQHMGYSSIKVFSRRKLDFEHTKVIEHIVDIENIETYSEDLRGDDLFICLGTTRKKARTIKRYEELDRDMPVNIAREARKRGLKRIVVVSSLGANINSRSYYPRIKGEMEKGIKEAGFDKTVITRPSLLLGERKEFRLGERIAILFYKVFSFIMVGKLRLYRAIHARDLAKAMLVLLYRTDEKTIFLSDELQLLADSVKLNNK